MYIFTRGFCLPGSSVAFNNVVNCCREYLLFRSDWTRRGLKSVKMESNTVNCLICALPCSPDFVINKSKTPLEFGGDDELIGEHLKSIFILRNILKIPQEVLCQFLVKGNGQFYPELWFNVCESCGESVTQFYAVLKQISKLERKLTTIQTELKGRIEATIHVENTDFVWGKIREESLKCHSSQVSNDKYNNLVVKTENERIIPSETNILTGYMPEAPDEGEDHQEEAKNYFQDQYQEENFEAVSDNDDDHDEIRFVTDFDPLEFQAKSFNTNQKSQGLNNINFPQQEPSTSNGSRVPRAYFYACQKCSFQCNTNSAFEAHQALHEEGAGAIPCDECGRPVLPEKMERHRSKHSNMGYHQRSGAKTVHRSGKYHYKCSQCPYATNSSFGFGRHLNLHEEGSGAVICGDCGFYSDPQKVTVHRNNCTKRYRSDYENGN